VSILFQKANLSDKSLNLANFNRMVDYVGRLANMTSPNMLIDRNPNGYVLKVLPSTTASTAMSYSDWAFGSEAIGNTVRVYNPALQHGEFLSFTPSGTYVDVLVTGGTSSTPNYIVCKYIRKTSLTIEATSYASIPTPSISYFWIPIASVYLDASGLAVIKCRLVIGMIFFSGEI
jgi:hypothetical protein